MSDEQQHLSVRCDTLDTRALEYSGGSNGHLYDDVKSELGRVSQELRFLQGSNAQIRVSFLINIFDCCNLSLG